MDRWLLTLSLGIVIYVVLIYVVHVWQRKRQQRQFTSNIKSIGDALSKLPPADSEAKQ